MIQVYTESGLDESIVPGRGSMRLRLKSLRFEVSSVSTVIIATSAEFRMTSVGFGEPSPPPPQGGSLQVALASEKSALGAYLSLTTHLVRLSFLGSGSTQVCFPTAATHTAVHVAPGSYLAVVDVFTDEAPPESMVVRHLTVMVVPQGGTSEPA